ncbi:MAG: hypothetical protein CMO74_02010 [Verrucomicrobiales bacterium]|nr:hypothetical protein [Verrucomicrobiales bacterium]|tara:strand:+ start:2322 stop:2924 length:603 start_codon:yes stop_codon:yes gene_type:complete
MKLELGILAMFLALPVLGGPAVTEQGKTTITSKELEMNFKPKRIFVYVGNVKVVDPQIDLMCEKMTVTFRDSKKKIVPIGPKPVIQPKIQPSPPKGKKPAPPPMMAQGGQIDVIVAEKNVVIINKEEGTRATGERGVFTAATNVLVLTGNPVLYRDGTKIHGDVIAWNRITESLRVTQAKTELEEKKDPAPTPKPAPKPE